MLWKFLILTGLAALAAAPIPAAGQEAPAPAAAVDQRQVFVVRHLPKGDGDDPSLTAEGARQAERLADLLIDKGIVAVFATPTRRARETGEPLARRLGIEVSNYDPRDPTALVQAVAGTGGNSLVVGHSNTVADLVSRFGGAAPEPLGEGDYGTIFIVDGSGSVEAVQLR